jgi:hypothetical protein
LLPSSVTAFWYASAASWKRSRCQSARPRRECALAKPGAAATAASASVSASAYRPSAAWQAERLLSARGSAGTAFSAAV